MLKNITGLSCLTLHTPNHLVFENTCQFYEQLGFKCIYTSHGGLDQINKVQNTPYERWLHLYSNQNTSLTLKIKNQGSTPSGHSNGKLSAFEPLSDVSSTHESHNLTITFIVECLKTQKIFLEELNFPYSLLPDEYSPTEICTLDPLSNRIKFSQSKNAFLKNFASPLRTQFTNSNSSEIQSVVNGSKGKRIAILTSGGDAPGMNAVVRAIVRMGIYKGFDVFTIHEGYKGLICGSSHIKKTRWEDVRGWISKGGTLIGSARSEEFKSKSGRLLAAKNIIEADIDYLIICGGDGSLKGADIFRTEFPVLVKELQDKAQVPAEAAKKELEIVGLVGSIDNDMCLTDATIGAYTSLHRICEAVDCIASTASSHSRAFVVEVMGRNCGWLATTAALATEADFVLIPEAPPATDWQEEMCTIIKEQRRMGSRRTIVIVAEGATDCALNLIKSQDVRNILENRLGLDTRVTTLGHIQRGGVPCAFDRILATLQGAEAVRLITRLSKENVSPLVTINENKISSKSLIEAVAMTSKVKELIDDKKFEEAMALRDPEFKEYYEVFRVVSSIKAQSPITKGSPKLKVAIIHVGAPAGGMNAATFGATRTLLNKGHRVFAISNGFLGLSKHQAVQELTWASSFGWLDIGGSEIGTNRALPSIDIGGFEAFLALGELERNRQNYPAFKIPMLCLPATISNNVPGTEYSLGSDTCLNSLAYYCDAIKQSASASRRRLFVCETQGGNSGFITTFGGLISGAMAVYTAEEGISIETLRANIEHLKYSFAIDKGQSHGGKLWLRNENSSKVYTTELVSKIAIEESKGIYDSRTAVPGHFQQGNQPSPLDRLRALRMAAKCIDFFEKYASNGEDNISAAVIGCRGGVIVYTPITKLIREETDMKERVQNSSWWWETRELVDILSGSRTFHSNSNI